MKRVGPATTEVTCDALKEKADATKLAVAYFGDAASKEFTEVFVDVAQNPTVSEKFQFYNLNDKDCATRYGAPFPGVVLFRKFDNSPLIYTGSLESTPIVDWMTASSIPTLIEFSEDYIEPIFGQRKAALFLFKEQGDNDKKFVEVFTEAANKLKGEILFVVSGVSEGIQQRLGEFIGVEQHQLPTLRLLDPANNMKKFTYAGKLDELTVDAVSKFIQDFKAGAIEPFLKSQEIPADNSAPLKTLVGKNFNDLVMNSEDDVFIKFYAPWCGHCKKLAPIWEELAKDLKDVKGLVIAEFDATANEVENVEVKGYPTLKFYPKGQKSAPVDYDAGRELEDFKVWLKEHSVAYKAHVGDAEAPKEAKIEL